MARRLLWTMVGTGALLGACGGTAGSGPAPTVMDAAMVEADAAVAVDVPVMPRGIPALGGFRHTPDSVRVREVATADDGLDRPRDLAFHPAHPDQLWITNFGSNSITVLINPGKANRTADTRGAFGADHFLVQPSAIAFGDNNFFATAQETDRVTQRSTPADFMGPTLWDSDLEIFNGGHASHLDMLHNSPNSNGIAWETGNAYWVVDGAHRALARYDFAEPHPHGGEDHSDGVLRRYAEGMLQFMPGVSAHLEYDHSNNRLYVTQPATNQVLMFDPAEATQGTRIAPNYDGSRQNRMNGGTMQPFINGAENGLMRPSGIALVGDTFYIADHGNSTITAFNREGQRIDWVDLSTHAAAGSLQGIAVDARGYIYVTDAESNRVLEIAPADAP